MFAIRDTHVLPTRLYREVGTCSRKASPEYAILPEFATAFGKCRLVTNGKARTNELLGR